MDYASVVHVLECLPRLVRDYRTDHDLSRRKMASEMGVRGDTIARIESGEGITVHSAVCALKWLAERQKNVRKGRP